MRSIARITLAASLAGALLVGGLHTPAGASDASRLQSVTYDVGTRSVRRDRVQRRVSDRARALAAAIGRRGYLPTEIREADEIPFPGKIFGADDREPVFDTDLYPWSTVAKVYATYPDGLEIVGSAIMIGPDQALTAGHVVYDARHGGWAEDVEIVPGLDLGFAPFGSAFADEIRSFAGWIDDTDYAFDFALLELDDDIGEDTGWLGLAARDDDALLNNLMNTAGYPTDLDGGEGMWYAADFADSVTPSSINLRGTFDAARGQSGSGVWLREGDDRLVVGVVSNESSRANASARVTDDVFDVLDAWLDGFEGPADLAPIAVTTSLPFDVSAGATGTVTFEVDNFGLRDATVDAAVFLDGGAAERIRIGGVAVTVQSEQFVEVAVPVTIPGDTPPGAYTLVAVVNDDRSVPESDSTNNEAAGPLVSVAPASSGGGGGDFYESISLPAKLRGRLEPNAEERYRFVVTDPTRKIKFRLRGRRFRGFALVARPDNSTFLLLPGASAKFIENQPQVGEWLIVVKNRPDANRSRRYKLNIKH